MWAWIGLDAHTNARPRRWFPTFGLVTWTRCSIAPALVTTGLLISASPAAAACVWAWDLTDPNEPKEVAICPDPSEPAGRSPLISPPIMLDVRPKPPDADRAPQGCNYRLLCSDSHDGGECGWDLLCEGEVREPGE